MMEHEPPAPPPLTSWQAPPPPSTWPPEFSIGAILKDSFARYAADPVRIFVIGLLPAIAGLVGGLLIGSRTPDLASLGSFIVATMVFTLVAGALGLISASITFALLEGGPQCSLGSAARWGLSRVGWLLATGILLVFAVGGIYIAVAIPVVLLFRFLGPLIFIPILVAVVLVLWAAMRLYPALVAVVVDRLDAGHAIRRSWAVTKPTGVWLRLFGCFLVLGLVLAPTSFLATAITAITGLPALVASIVGGLVLAFVGPLGICLLYSAYRRLVGPVAATAPITPTFVAPPAPAGATDESASPGSPGPIVVWTPELPGARAAPPAAGFIAPVLGTRGRAFVGVTIVLAIVGLVSAPLAIGSILGRVPTMPSTTFPGNVPAGAVVFGTSGNLRTCTVSNQMTTAAAFSPIAFMGHMARTATPSDEVRLVVTRDGTEILNKVQTAATYVCLGTATPESDIESGTYVFEIRLNGEASAIGTLVVQ